MRRPTAIAVLAYLVFVAIALYSDIKDFFWAHPWWQSFLAAVPAIALAVFAGIELTHSGEANTLRSEANHLQKRIADLTRELDAERNKHLERIADNTARPLTRGERNADILRKHLRANVTVSEGQGGWPNTPEIVEVKDDIVTLFTPRTGSSPQAWCARVHCDDLEISDIPRGSCPLQLKIIKRYGPDAQLGEITRWEDRDQPAAIPTFAKGDTAYHATFSKPDSSERRTLAIFTSKGGTNSFLLEASTGETVTGDNVEISKQFMIMYVQYEASGFNRNSAGSGVSPYKLFIHTN
jgi:hypothetical protein